MNERAEGSGKSKAWAKMNASAGRSHCAQGDLATLKALAQSTTFHL